MEEKFEIVPININEDMHNHTKGSDGKQSSLRFILRASHYGRNIVSITDHNSVEGYKNLENDLYSVLEVIKEDKSYNPDKLIKILEQIKILKGTELITSYKGSIIEILGYDFDINKMQEEIKKLQTTIKKKSYVKLYETLSQIVDEKQIKFDKKILDDAYEKILKEGKGGVIKPFYEELISHEENLHFLKYIDEDGNEKIADTLKIFINKHLYNQKSELFVNMEETRPAYKDTIDAIHRAGGKAILAHPGRYIDKFSVEENIDNMISQGLDGIEVFYPDHSDEFSRVLLEKVRQYGLIACGGSDDHNNIKEGIQYGIGKITIPNIPETKWIQDSVNNNMDFIKTSEKIQEVIKELKILREERQKSNIKENECER